MVSSFTIALFVHLLGVLAFAAGIAVAAAAFELARRRDDAAEIALVLKLARAGAALVGPGSLLVLGGGLWLVDASAADFGSRWLDTALALFVVAFVLGGLGGQRPKRARQLAERLAADGRPVSAELRALLDDPLSLAMNYVSALLVLVILGLMVFKP